jgi:hypothetical protein
MKGKQMKDGKIDFVMVGEPHTAAAAEQSLDQRMEIALEIGKHAAVESLRTLKRITDALPTAIDQATAQAVAHAYIRWSLDTFEREFSKALPHFAAVVENLRQQLEDQKGAEIRKQGAELRKAFGFEE